MNGCKIDCVTLPICVKRSAVAPFTVFFVKPFMLSFRFAVNTLFRTSAGIIFFEIISVMSVCVVVGKSLA